ncbi:MAG: DUF1566 domain-containing protein [Verrucomicrobiota bacterium]
MSDSDRSFFRVHYDTFGYLPVDTNQSRSYDLLGQVIDPEPSDGAPLSGQDAAYAVSPPSYQDNGDGTVTDRRTGLIWQQVPPLAFYSWSEAQSYAENLVLAGESDWRLPTIKELFSLADYNGSSRAGIERPYLDESVFTIHDPLSVTNFFPASTGGTKRAIDGQFWSSTHYVGRTINDDSATFGFNFIDGRLKGYPNGLLSGPTGTAFVRCVRGNSAYGKNNFIDNGDGTITDLATGLMWMAQDSGAFPAAGSQGDGTLDWQEALAWAEALDFAGYDDWLLPDIKQLHTLVDYSRAPDAEEAAAQTVAIDPLFSVSETESWFWSSTSLGDDLFAWGVYQTFGRSLAIDQTTLEATVNAHGAGAVRSDPKTGNPADYAAGHGPQNDQVRIYNYARAVRSCLTPPLVPATEPGDLVVTLAGTAPEDLAVGPRSVTLGGVEVDLETVFRSSRNEISFDFETYGLPPGDYAVEVRFADSEELLTGVHRVHASILLLIVYDWGHDASPLDNQEPGVFLAKMPTLQSLADEGLRFTQAYSQPACSPTRASILTGRQVWQHGVGMPADSGNFSEAEITLPEIFATMGAPHDLLSVGKWHLGGEDSGYADRGGWPEFYGINGGGVGNYANWSKNSNGSVETTSVYSTTDQVNEAEAFIRERVAAGQPWFAWVAFNAPHSPYHDPPAELAPPDGYSAQEVGESTSSFQYRKMLEALDTEMGRLLQAIDPAQTTILLMGDNGTPGAIVQAPYGNGNSKGSIYNGGTHVPFLVKGPAVTVAPGSTSDALVHCVDLFATILELAGINELGVPQLAAQNTQSESLLPLLEGGESGGRCVVCESNDGDEARRSLRLASHPDYKLIVLQDLTSELDDPIFEFYNVGWPAFDENEQSPLDLNSLSGAALAAYQACLAKEASLGGGYSDGPSSSFDTLYLELPTTGVTPVVPGFTRPNGNEIAVTSVTVDGQAATILGRFNSGTSLADESDDLADRYWVKVRLAPANGGPYAAARVIFPDQPAGQGGAAREFDAVSIEVRSSL